LLEAPKRQRGVEEEFEPSHVLGRRTESPAHSGRWEGPRRPRRGLSTGEMHVGGHLLIEFGGALGCPPMWMGGKECGFEETGYGHLIMDETMGVLAMKGPLPATGTSKKNLRANRQKAARKNSAEKGEEATGPS